VIGAPMYAEGTGPRAIAALNDRVQAWNEATQVAMGSVAAPTTSTEKAAV